MDNEWLLTYRIGIDRGFEWLSSEEELRECIDEKRRQHGDRFEVFDAVHVIQAENIEIDEI